jgi:hypothetical protein
MSQALVAHACNRSYSGGSSKLEAGQANSLQDPILKIHITKKGWWRAQSEGPEFKPQYHKKKKKKKEKIGKKKERLGTVVHTCNPSYSRARDWKDCGSRSV